MSEIPPVNPEWRTTKTGYVVYTCIAVILLGCYMLSRNQPTPEVPKKTAEPAAIVTEKIPEIGVSQLKPGEYGVNDVNDNGPANSNGTLRKMVYTVIDEKAFPDRIIKLNVICNEPKEVSPMYRVGELWIVDRPGTVKVVRKAECP